MKRVTPNGRSALASCWRSRRPWQDLIQEQAEDLAGSVVSIKISAIKW